MIVIDTPIRRSKRLLAVLDQRVHGRCGYGGAINSRWISCSDASTWLYSTTRVSPFELLVNTLIIQEVVTYFDALNIQISNIIRGVKKTRIRLTRIRIR